MTDRPEGLDDAFAGQLRAALDAVLAHGMAENPIAHAGQVAAVMTVLDRAFRADGLRCVLVGGAAIEVHAPGAYMSHDLDVVIDALFLPDRRARVGGVFARLGFTPQGRHWERNGLYVEVPGPFLEDPSELYSSPPWSFRVVTREVLLRDRLVGFKHWGQTAYGSQAIAMLRNFGSTLDMTWLTPQLQREAVMDAYEALTRIVASGTSVDDNTLDALGERLRQRPGSTPVAADPV